MEMAIQLMEKTEQYCGPSKERSQLVRELNIYCDKILKMLDIMKNELKCSICNTVLATEDELVHHVNSHVLQDLTLENRKEQPKDNFEQEEIPLSLKEKEIPSG